MVVQDAYNKLIIAQFCCVLFGFQGIFLGIVEYEWSQQFGQTSMKNIRWLLNSLNMMVSLCLILGLILRYQLKIWFRRTSGELTIEDNLYSTGAYKQLSFECFCALVTPNPFIQDYSFQSTNSNFVDGQSLKLGYNTCLLAAQIVL